MGTSSVAALVVDYGHGRTVGEELPEGAASRVVEAVVQLSDGSRQEVRGRLGGDAWWLMAEGDSIQVLVDGTGRVVDFDRPAMDASAASRSAEVRAARSEQSSLRHLLRQDAGLGGGQLRGAMGIAREALTVPRQLWRSHRDAAAPAPPAVDPAPPQLGVDFSTFVAVQAAIVSERVPGARHDEVAVRHGVPPGGWAPAAAAWQRLVRTDPSVGQAFGAAYHAAVRGPRQR